MRSFWKCDRGNIAVGGALAMIAIIGAAGLALDYSRVSKVRTNLQAEADAAALSARDGGWLNPNDYRVEKSAQVPTSLMAVLGFSKVDVDVEAVARFPGPGLVYDKPELAALDPAAMDYNRISVYCFSEATRSRSQMTVIADNNGNVFDYSMPVCELQERLEVHLYNVRLGRVDPALINDPNAEVHQYFSDGANLEMLETVSCATMAECRYWSEGGIIPEGTDRVPVRDNKKCAPGKYQYYGWEDRPADDPIRDSDFNDIRLIIKCGYPSTDNRRGGRLIQ